MNTDLLTRIRKRCIRINDAMTVVNGKIEEVETALNEAGAGVHAAVRFGRTGDSVGYGKIHDHGWCLWYGRPDGTVFRLREAPREFRARAVLLLDRLLEEVDRALADLEKKVVGVD